MIPISFWTYIEKEIIDLKDIFSEIFQTPDLDRDYENVWEWMEGYSEHFKAHINISREHNWETGEYHRPLIIRVNFEKGDQINDPLLLTIGSSLSKKLQADVFYGELKYIGDDEFTENIKYTFNHLS